MFLRFSVERLILPPPPPKSPMLHVENTEQSLNCYDYANILWGKIMYIPSPCFGWGKAIYTTLTLFRWEFTYFHDDCHLVLINKMLMHYVCCDEVQGKSNTSLISLIGVTTSTKHHNTTLISLV